MTFMLLSPTAIMDLDLRIVLFIYAQFFCDLAVCCLFAFKNSWAGLHHDFSLNTSATITTDEILEVYGVFPSPPRITFWEECGNTVLYCAPTSWHNPDEVSLLRWAGRSFQKPDSINNESPCITPNIMPGKVYWKAESSHVYREELIRLLKITLGLPSKI